MRGTVSIRPEMICERYKKHLGTPNAAFAREFLLQHVGIDIAEYTCE
jgi:hypothetical protein